MAGAPPRRHRSLAVHRNHPACRDSRLHQTRDDEYVDVPPAVGPAHGRARGCGGGRLADLHANRYGSFALSPGQPMPDHPREFIPVRIAVMTVSDTRGRENDVSGDTLEARIRDAG